jgi:hypothetical protein
MSTFAELTSLTQSINSYLASKESKKSVSLAIVGSKNEVQINITHEYYGLISNCITKNNNQAYLHLYQLLIMTME